MTDEREGEEFYKQFDETADEVTSSARSAKVAVRWAIWASVIALLAIAWNVRGS